MKKTIFLLGGIMVSIFSFAQISIGVQATGAMSSAVVKSKFDIDFDKSAKAFPESGIAVQYDVSKRISLRSGVIFLRQGVKLNTSIDEILNMTAHTRLNYLQMPVHALYNFSAGKNRLYAGIGGYAGYGVSGEVKNILWFKTDDGGYEFTEKLPAFKKSEDDGANLERLDYGVSALAGIQIRNAVFIQAGYKYGLANISRDKDDTYRNNGFQLTVGYFFWRK